MKKLFTLITLCLFLVVLSAQTDAATRYADPAGSGTACTVIGTPCTLSVAVGQLVVGDTLYLRAGTYAVSRLSLELPTGTAWTAGNFTTIASYSTEVATFLGSGWPFHTANTSAGYVRFDGTGAGECGASHNCGIVANCNSDAWASCVSIKSNSNLPFELRGVEIKNSGSIALDASAPTNEDGHIFTKLYIHNTGCTDFDNSIYLAGSNITVTYSEITGGSGAALQLYGGATMTGNVFAYNWIHNTSGGVNAGIPGVGTCGGNVNGFRTQGIVLYGGSGARIFGNVISNLIDNGNVIGAIQLHNHANAVVYNNTVYNNGVGIVNETAANGEIVKNNLVIDNASGNISGSFGTSSNNITTGTAVSHFVSTGSNNYSLVSGSTAIDAGTASIATGVTACLNGSAPDAGAIETLGTPTATVNGADALITVSNNCTSQMLPASSVTGWTFKKNGSGDTVTANSRSGSNSFAATLTSAFIGGDTCLFSYSQSGNTTASNNIGSGTGNNQEVLAFTDASCTNITAGGGSVGLAHWKAYLLQGATDTAWTAKCSEDFTNCIVPPGAKLWVRSKLLNNSGTDFAAFNYRPKWRQNGGSYFFLSDSFNYGASCTNDPSPNCAVEISGVRMLGTKTLNLGTVISNASATTQDQLTSSVANVGCVAVTTPSSIPSLTLANNNETECAHAVEFGQTPGDTLEMCPFTDTNTALTCSTPIKFTIGSYQSVR